MDMVPDNIKKIKSHKNMKSIETRLGEYIEFSNETKRFSDEMFYKEILDYIKELKEKKW
jgi:hypothetical protein